MHFVFLDYAAVFSKLIARTAKDIDVLIDSLPSEESSLELQVITFFLRHLYLKLLLIVYIMENICRAG